LSSLSSNFFRICSKIKYFSILGYKKGKATIVFPPPLLLLFLDAGSGMNKKSGSGIRDNYYGSATLLIISFQSKHKRSVGYCYRYAQIWNWSKVKLWLCFVMLLSYGTVDKLPYGARLKCIHALSTNIMKNNQQQSQITQQYSSFSIVLCI
jgi:hypothetical protein